MEFIKRKTKAEKDAFEGNVQFGINSWGHFTIRLIDLYKEDKDTVVVLTSEETRKLMGFIKKALAGDFV